MAIPVQNRSASAPFEARAARAELLSRASEVAREPLQFAAGLCRAQGRVAAGLESLHAATALCGKLAADLDVALPQLFDVARFAAQAAPPVLREAAAARCRDDAPTAKTRLALFWKGERSSGEDYLSRAMLRPYVELLRLLERPPDRPRARARCPFCGGAPIVGCRRGGSESEGAARFLVCALCGLEWPVARILCPACFEGDPHKLPSFTGAQHPLARIESCETCRCYVKSIDLSLDARPIPEIDDLASLSLDLWAIEQGFQRLEPGLAGV